MSAASRFYGAAIGQYLAKEGLLPEDCINVDVVMHSNDLMVLRYDVALTGPKFAALARGFAAFAAQEAERVASHG